MQHLSAKHRIPLLRAAYDLGSDEQTWMETLRGLCAPSLGRENPDRVFLGRYQLTPTGFSLLESSCPDDEIRTFFAEAAPHAPVDEVDRAFAATDLFCTFSDWMGGAGVPNFYERFHYERFGIADHVGFRTSDGGRDYLLCVRVLAQEQGSGTPEAKSWSEAIAHLATGFRLRRVLGNAPLHPDHGSAVMEPNGRTAHATGSARGIEAQQALRRTVSQMEHSRTRKGAKTADAWSPLVEGKWTLVDHFDSDGRRYYVAVDNAPQFASWTKLSERERNVARMAAQGLSNGEISYSLTLSLSSTATYLARALQKLGLARRTDLPLIRESSARTLAVGRDKVHVISESFTRPTALTEAEFHVARLAASGRSDQEIACERNTARSTVANLLRSTYKKLKVQNRSSLAEALRDNSAAE